MRSPVVSPCCRVRRRFPHFRASLATLISGIGLTAAVPTEYTLTDITNWGPAELAGLPHFDRYVPVPPAGASAAFEGVGDNGAGIVVGTRDDWAVYVHAATETELPDWGPYRWSYTYWDGRDYHFSSGTVHHSVPRAVNVRGQIAGHANLGGSGSGSGASTAYADHIFLHETASGAHLDLTPTAHRADARDLNDRGELTGFWSDSTGYHPFRWSPTSGFTDLVYDGAFSHNISPSVLNNHGHIAGLITVWTTPRAYIPFLSAPESAIAELPYPDTDKNYKASIADINDHDIIVGFYHKDTAPLETTALRWSLQDGMWIAEDLVELIDDNGGFVLDRALAVNDAGHIIVSGHDDGGPDNTWNTHRFLLTPTTFAPPAVTTLSPVLVRATSATLQAKINPAMLETTSAFHYGPTEAYGVTAALPLSDGTHPLLATLALNQLTPHTTYHFRASATNTKGTTHGRDASFTTPWDWPSWALAHLGAADPTGDHNANGMPDLIDYATGDGSAPTLTINAGQRVLHFHRSVAADGVRIVIQLSNDLATWTDTASYALEANASETAWTKEIARAPDGPEGEWIDLAIQSDLPFIRFRAELY